MNTHVSFISLNLEVNALAWKVCAPDICWGSYVLPFRDKKAEKFPTNCMESVAVVQL